MLGGCGRQHTLCPVFTLTRVHTRSGVSGNPGASVCTGAARILGCGTCIEGCSLGADAGHLRGFLLL